MTINDANGRQLETVGINYIFERFSKYFVKFYFYVLERLETAYALGGDFWYRFVG